MSSPIRRRLHLVGALSTIALLLAACGESTGEGPTEAMGSFDAIVEAAQEEGSVVVYSAYNAELTQSLADAFEDEYSITVQVVRQASADLNARFAAESEAGSLGADVLWQPDPVFAGDVAEKGWLAPLDPAQIPNLERVDAAEQTEYTVPVLEQPWGIAYNTDLVTGTPPTSWEDLITGDAIARGLLVAAPQNSVATAGVYNFWLDTFGEEFFTELQQTQNYSMGDSVSNAIQQVAAGEVGAFVPAPLSTVSTVQKAGAPVEVVVPDNTTGFAMLASISSTAPNPNAARLFVEFLLSDSGQVIAVGDLAVPVVESVTTGVSRPAEYVPTDNVATSSRLDEIVELVTP